MGDEGALCIAAAAPAPANVHQRLLLELGALLHAELVEARLSSLQPRAPAGVCGAIDAVIWIPQQRQHRFCRQRNTQICADSHSSLNCMQGALILSRGGCDACQRGWQTHRMCPENHSSLSIFTGRIPPRIRQQADHAGSCASPGGLAKQSDKLWNVTASYDTAGTCQGAQREFKGRLTLENVVQAGGARSVCLVCNALQVLLQLPGRPQQADLHLGDCHTGIGSYTN